MNDPSEQFYFRQRQRNRLYEAVAKAVTDGADRYGIRKKDIAETLRVTPSQVSKWLSGPSNWTIDTVSDILYALKSELDYSVVFMEDRSKQNEFHDLNFPASALVTHQTAGTNPTVQTKVIYAQGVMPPPLTATSQTHSSVSNG